jgi:adenosylcobinamide-GDP ribazoletransferase
VQALRHEVRLVAVALQFLTRVPVPPMRTWDDAWLNDCVRYFPLVGALVGAFAAAVVAATALLWPPFVVAVLAVGATAWITGAFHEDGLADTFDALGGHVPRERALVILKDSRIGSYGALALVVVTLARVAALAAALASGLGTATAAIVLAHALGRLAAVVVMKRLPYAGDIEHAKAKPLATSVRARDVGIALAWSLAVVGAAAAAGAGSRAIAALLAVFVVAAVMARWLRGRLGGYTGDTLGATEQLAEATVLLVFAAQWTA